MFSQLHPVDVQGWILRVLEALPSYILLSISKAMAGNQSEVQKYLAQCILFAQQRKEDAEYCADFDAVCEAIVRVTKRQEKEPDSKKVKKKEYKDLMCNKTGHPMSTQELGRIRRGKGRLHIETVNCLCSHLPGTILHRFWKNQLLLLFPYVSEKERRSIMAGPPSSLERDSLEMLLRQIPANILAQMQNQDPELAMLCQGQVVSDEPDCIQGDLYKTIHDLLHQNGMNLDMLSRDELLIGEGTWSNWKKTQIPRWAMLYIAIRFDMNYLQMLRFLQMAGYRPGYCEFDMKIRRYFSTREGSREELLQTLRSERPW